MKARLLTLCDFLHHIMPQRALQPEFSRRRGLDGHIQSI